ncbi:M20/M25/M40 family metallo-hydrolase [uncultured Winogradskyella sp.]|uniref:M20/M25/M40 family metallo-hydrolase n=1 Tax=uncultured Winogradskyella sp. TaxID=395353 RepID=UPI002627BF6D|nr:M20/M25/M40 family metallo-hydrolase [uncultured Winogradskyella sp.]
MKYKLLSLLFCVLSITYSCAQTTDTKKATFNEAKLLERLEELSSDKYEGRETGKKGNDSARAYIINEFKSLNISGFNGKFEQTFTFSSRNKGYRGVNILAEIKGAKYPDKYIIISAHYDHLGIRDGIIYNGADDDASGVSALISFAESMIKNPPNHSVILAAFDAEEIGLQGAKHFVKTIEKDKVILNINMDMISRSQKDELYVVGGRYNDKLKSIIDNFENQTSTKLLQGHDGTDGKQNWTMASDHGPFHLAKIPFLYFGNEDHEAYHKPTDDFEDITPQFYKNAVNIILAVFNTIDASGL